MRHARDGALATRVSAMRVRPMLAKRSIRRDSPSQSGPENKKPATSPEADVCGFDVNCEGFWWVLQGSNL